MSNVIVFPAPLDGAQAVLTAASDRQPVEE